MTEFKYSSKCTLSQDKVGHYGECPWVVTPIYTFIKDFVVPDAFPWEYMVL